ncbi:family 10 glycosylhydrolase [Muricauda sp. ANG21]|uniref:glycoside hydrolase family 10 protein n=1 Tax=Allomuricauda sp. ANG21 TaxID=3042468 RepID=UPI00345266C6
MKKLVYLFLCLSITNCAVHHIPEEEFRGFWIATVVNIDWPKDPTDITSKKKTDFIQLLDFYQEMNFNAAIVQVRTAGDAFYETDLAPWSRYLTGKEGKAPENFENPLQWMIEETHKRGMEFHAWLNPYRATFDLDTLALSPNHDFYQHPDWMLKYGKKYYYNPGLPEVQEKFAKIVEELVVNYELDAIHFDDYFYPYKIKGEVFKDSLTFQTYGLPNQSLEDWRRSNVDSLVKNVYQTIKKNKPWVQFGISPFGVWKNKSTDPDGSDTRAGQTTYEDLYADPVLWVNEGWLDYLAPQAYWSMDYPPASHKAVGSWWANATPNTNLYIGNGTYKIKNNSDKAWKKKKEIPKQLTFARNQKNIDGNIFFSAKSLIGQHEKVVKTLKKKFYPLPSKNPSTLNKVLREIQLPGIESVKKQDEVVELCIAHTDSIPRFLNYYQLNGNEKQLIGKNYISESQNSGCFQLKLTKKQRRNKVVISISDAFGNESELLPLNLK